MLEITDLSAAHSKNNSSAALIVLPLVADQTIGRHMQRVLIPASAQGAHKFQLRCSGQAGMTPLTHSDVIGVVPISTAPSPSLWGLLVQLHVPSLSLLAIVPVIVLLNWQL